MFVVCMCRWMHACVYNVLINNGAFNVNKLDVLILSLKRSFSSQHAGLACVSTRFHFIAIQFDL